MRRWLRRILVTIGVLAALVLAAPFAVDTAFVRARVARAIGEETGLHVTIGSLSAGWWSALELRDLAVEVPRGDAAGEFAGSPVLALDHARFDPGLGRLLLGSGPYALDVDGLVVTIEERAGGRTNVDGLLRRLLAPAPRARPPEEPPRPPPSIEEPLPFMERRAGGPHVRIRIRDSRIELRRLVYRPPERRINPFEEDVPIRPIDEGVDRYALEAARVEFGIEGDALALTAELAVRLGEQRAGLRADLRHERGGLAGEIDVDGFDLRALEPLVRRPVAGVVTLRASGRMEPGASRGRAEFECTGLDAGGIREEWLRGRVDVAESADAVQLLELDVSSASGRFAADGRLSIPKEEPTRPSGTLRGELPLGPIHRLLGRREPPGPARVRFELDTDLSPSGGRASGRIAVDDFSRAERPEEMLLRFALLGERASRRLTIQSLAFRSEFARADLRGSLVRPPHPAANLTGSVRGDLGRALAIAAAYEPSIDPGAADGVVLVLLDELRYGAEEGLAIRASATGEGLRARGGGDSGRPPVDVDAFFDGTFHDAFDRLELRRARIGGLEARGAVRGLRAAEGVPAGEAHLEGGLRLSPRLLRLVTSAPVERLAGDAALQVHVTSDGARATAEGRVTVRDLDFAAGEGTLAEREIACEATVSTDGRSLDGTATLSSGSVGVALRAFAWDPARGIATAEGEIELTDAARLRPWLLPDSFAWSGAHRGTFRVEHGGSATRLDARVTAPALTFQRDGHGLDREAATLRAVVARDGDAWSVRDAELQVPSRGVVAAGECAGLGTGAATATLRAKTRFESFPRYVPTLHGALEVEFVRARDGRMRLDAVAPDLEQAGRILGRVQLRLDDATAGDSLRVRRWELRPGRAAPITGDARLGDDFALHVRTKGDDLATLAAFVRGLDGEGPYEFDGDLRLPLERGASPLRVQGRGSAHAVTVGPTSVGGLAFDLDARFRPTREALEDLRLTGTARAATLRSGHVRARNLRVANRGRGTLRRDGGGDGHRFERIEIQADLLRLEERVFEAVAVEGGGVLHHPDLAREDALDLEGDLSFKKGQAVVLWWHDATAKLRYHARVAELQGLRATANGGRVTGGARVDLGRDDVPWSVRLEVADAQLDAGFTDPLSYVLPILRLTGQAQAAKGRATSKLELSAVGTDWASVQKSLDGKGSLRLNDAEITGSLLMPLLSGRIGRLLLNKPYQIPDSTVHWSIEDGLVTTEPLQLNGRPFPISLGGTVSLDGRLNYVVHPGLLLVPLRVTGTWGKVVVLPAPAEALPNWPWKK